MDTIPINAAQALYLPWLKAKIDSLAVRRHGYVPTGTPAVRHRITDRSARKAAARAYGAARHAHIEAGGTYRDFVMPVTGE